MEGINSAVENFEGILRILEDVDWDATPAYSPDAGWELADNLRKTINLCRTMVRRAERSGSLMPMKDLMGYRMERMYRQYETYVDHANRIDVSISWDGGSEGEIGEYQKRLHLVADGIRRDAIQLLGQRGLLEIVMRYVKERIARKSN